MESLPTVTNNTTFEQIASLIGQDVPTNGGGPSINLLKINRAHEDDNGRLIPAGSFFVNLPEGTVYATTIKFQLCMQRYQYMHYDAEANEMVSKSVLAKNLYPQTEIPDTIGTMRCGSVPAAQRDSLSAEQALKQKDIKCFRMLYGKVTFNDAVDAEGKSVEVANLPVLWRARGSNFMPISKPLDALSAQKKPFIFFNLNASLNRQKNGGLVYYVSDLSIGDGPLDFTEDDQELLKFFDENINSENKQVMADYDKALRMSGDIIDADSVDASIDSALNDDLPESLTA